MEVSAEHDKTQQKAVTASANKRVHKVWLGTYVILALACLAIYFLFRLQVFEVFGRSRFLIQRALLGGFFVFLVLIITKTAELIIAKKSHTKAVRYNLFRLVRLLCVLLIVLVIISFLFENWYTAAVSLGLISLILGFALQTPIASLIGWIYIVIRQPYKVGDRIQVDTFTGDVIDINYLDTTLWEFGGEYLSNDLPTGRLICFPNSLVLQSAVYNYSWKKFPYIWNEIPFHIAYESDLAFIETTMKEIAKKELGPEMSENIEKLKIHIQSTSIDEMEIKEYPFVNFRTNTNTWLEAIIIYLVEPKKAGTIRSRMVKSITQALLQQPDKVMFPKSNMR